jgi:hypothetical protein
MRATPHIETVSLSFPPLHAPGVGWYPDGWPSLGRFLAGSLLLHLGQRSCKLRELIIRCHNRILSLHARPAALLRRPNTPVCSCYVPDYSCYVQGTFVLRSDLARLNYILAQMQFRFVPAFGKRSSERFSRATTPSGLAEIVSDNLPLTPI